MGATNTLYLCLHSQTRIDDILADAANPLRQIQQTLGVTSALKSAANIRGQAIPVQSPQARPTAGSNRKVVVQGRVKACPSVVTSKPDPCTGVTAETTDLIDEEVVVANANFVRFTIDRTVYQDTCDTPDGSAAAVISYKMLEAVEAVLKAENAEHIAAFIADVDNYFSGAASTINGGTEQTVNLYSSTAPIIPQPGNMFRIVEEYRRKGYTSISPIVVGGTTLAKWAFDLNLYLGNLDGLDIAKIPANLPTFIDYDFDSQAQVVGPNAASRLLSWIPGHAQRVTYLDYAEGSPLRRTTDEITKTTMNFGDEVMDVTVYDNQCDDEVDITVGRFSDLYILSTNFFDAQADCGGQESILSWITDCADTDCDDIDLPGNVIT